MLNENTQPAQIFDKETLTWLRKLCHQTKAVVEHRYSQLQALDAQLTEPKKICTGWVIWRDTNGTAKMIIHHKVRQGCPLHGQPDPRKRLRCYVGTDPIKQAKANQAIENEQERAKIQREYNELASKLHTAGRALCEFYRALDYPAPKFSES